MRCFVPAFFCLLLGGCVMIGGPVTGQLENGSETFTGSVTQKMSGEGALAIKTSTGASCEGAFEELPDPGTGYVNVSGTMSCSDGRSGTFHIVKGAFQKAVATGDLGGQPITMILQ